MSEQTALQEEVRKVQLTGRSSYIISLPKKWVEEMSINPGDRLTFLRQSNASLLLLPATAAKLDGQGEATIYCNPSDNPNSILRRIISLYLVGFGLITVKARAGRVSAAQREVIKDAAKRRLIGAEIVNESSREVTLQILLRYPELTVGSALRRMVTMAMSMHRDAILALEGIDHDLCRQVIGMDDEVDRFTLYIIRQLKLAVQNQRLINEIGLESPRDCLGYRLITASIEGAADQAAEIAENVVSMKAQADRQVLDRVKKMSLRACSVFEDSVKALYKKDYVLADQVVERAKAIERVENEIVEFISRSQKLREAPSLRLIVESVKRTAEYASDIAEVVLNIAIFNTLEQRVGAQTVA